jgi:hypothetical protein
MLKGFKPAEISDDLRLIMSVEALQKVGKTHFGLTAPGPIALIDLNADVKGVIEKFIKAKKKILLASHCYASEGTQVDAQKLWEKVQESYYDALASKEVRSIVLDTGTDAWELARYAEFGKLGGNMPRYYEHVNGYFKRMIQKAKQGDKNVIFTHRLKDVYVNDKRTDKLELAGFGGMEYDVEVNVRLYRTEDNLTGVRILDCRPNREINGNEWEEPLFEIGFPFVASQVYEGTSEEDWT